MATALTRPSAQHFGRWTLFCGVASLCLASVLRAAPLARAPFAYITNFDDDTVSVIDTGTNSVVKTIAGIPSPFGVAVSPSGGLVYVTTINGIAIIDAGRNQRAATLKVGDPEGGIATNPAGTRVYVTNASGTVSVIDTASKSLVATVPVGPDPHGVAVHPDGTRVYVANFAGFGGPQPSTVSVIDTATNTVVATIPVGAGPQGVAVHPAGTKVYVTNAIGGSGLYVIDTATNTVEATIPMDGAEGVAVNPSGTRAYVARSGDFGRGSVAVVDTSSNTIVATIGVADVAFGVAVHPDETRVYVTAQGRTEEPGSVSVIDTVSNTYFAAIPVGHTPVSLGQFIAPMPDDAGFVPPDEAGLACTQGVQKAAARLVTAIVKCHMDAAKTAAFNEEACEAAAKSAYDLRVGVFIATCPACLQANVSMVRDAIESTLDAATGQLYCAGTVPLGGDDPGFVPPDASALGCEQGAAKRVGTLFRRLITCHIRLAHAVFDGTPLSDASCEDGAKVKYDAALARFIGTCPSCLQANVASVRDQAETFIDNLTGEIYCAQ